MHSPSSFAANPVIEKNLNNKMALPTGNSDDMNTDGAFATPQSKEEFDSSILRLHQNALLHLMPAPAMPRLTDKVLMVSHLRELNELLVESGMLVDGSFVVGYEMRCRSAIKDSFSSFPEISRQVGLWFGRGISWSDIQSDLVKIYASPREVSLALASSLSQLVYGPQFPSACRDLFVTHSEMFERRPHKVIDFVNSVCAKLPGSVRDQIIRRLSSETDDDIWQLARLFWVPGSSDSLVSLIESFMRSDSAVRGFTSAPPGRQSADKVYSVSPQSTWLSTWVRQYPCVFVVEPHKDIEEEKLRSLQKTSLASKGPLKRKTRDYFLFAFSDSTSAERILRSSFAKNEFRPFELRSNMPKNM